MSETYDAYISRKNFSLLNGVRALAILAVVWHHSPSQNFHENPIFGRGYLGVDLFFVLSGFLITTLLLREHSQYGQISLKKFYIRRTLRIFPVYYGYLLCVAIWYWVSGSDKFDSYIDFLPTYLLYLTNIIEPSVSHFFERGWSLAVEEQFYLLWPAMLILIGLRGAVAVSGLLVLVSIISPYLVNISHNSNIQHLFIPFRTILMGCFLAVALNNYKGYRLLHSFLGNKYSIIVVFLCIVAILISISGSFSFLTQLSIHILFTAFIACTVLNEENSASIILSNRHVQKIGVVSYGIYIIHGQLYGLVLIIMDKIPFNLFLTYRVIFFTIFIFISYIVATLSFKYFESYFLKLKTKFNH